MTDTSQANDNTRVIRADLSRADHADAIVELLDLYSRDQYGAGAPLPDNIRQELVGRMREHPGTLVFLAYQDTQAVGIIICFTGFSTFRARPLLNLHDVAVHPDHRGQGIGSLMFDAVEQTARELGFCKMTLEVRNDNPASRLYHRKGFEAGDPDAGGYSFLTREL